MKNLEVRRLIKKAACVALVVCMTVNVTACGAKEAGQEAVVITDENREDVLAAVLDGQIASGDRADASCSGGKEETVYVMADAAGGVSRIIVSDWLKNPEGASKLEDATDLLEVKNVKGYEAYTEGKNGELIWDAKGSDIYYQGTSQKELPVKVKVSYMLDGKELSPEEIAGKSGKVTIRFDYENMAHKTVVVNGAEEEIAVPFAMISGIILPDEKFRNVEVTNGRVISEGSSSIVVGAAFPGLRDSIRLDEMKENLESSQEKEQAEEIKIPEYVEVTADATDFSLDMTMTMAMSDVLGEVNLNDSIDLSDINSSMDELTDASDQLKDGTTELFDGTAELLDGTGELKDGTEKLLDGAGELDDGTTKLLDGTVTLKDGAAELKDGVTELDSKSGDLDEGAGKLNKGASDLEDGAASLKNGTSELAAGTGDLKAGASQLKDGITKMKEMLGIGVSQLGEGVEGILEGFTKEGGLLQGSRQLADTTSQFDTLLNEYLDSQIARNAQTSGKISQMLTLLESAQAEAEQNQVQAEAALAAAEAERNRAKEAIGAACQAAQSVMETEQQVSVTSPLSGSETKMETRVTAGTDPQEVQAAVDAYTRAQEQVEALRVQAAGAEAAARTLSESREELAASLSYLNTAGHVGASEADLGDTSYIVVLKQASRSIALGANAMNTGIQTVYQGIAKLAQGMTGMTSSLEDKMQGLPALAAGADQLYAGAAKADAGAAQLDTGAGALVQGAKTLKSGTGDLKDGTGKLTEGTGRLKDGAGKLYDGAGDLDEGAQELRDGAEKLYDGAGELKDGMFTFDEEGIRKLTDLFGDDVQSVTDRIDAVMEAGKEYSTFTRLADGMDGSVKFIYKTDSVKN